MKNLFFLVAILLVSTNAFSQLTINNSHLPRIGDSYQTKSADTTGVTPGNAGSNQTWNFSTLNVTGKTITSTYVDPASTPYGSSFTNANIAASVDGDSYTYFTASSNGLVYHGMGMESTTMLYQNPVDYMRFPLIFNDSYTDNFASAYTLEDLNVFTSGTITVKNDGYGTINLPGGQNYNVARVKIVQNIKDSMVMKEFTYTRNSVVTTYQWYISNLKYPVLSMVVTESSSQFGTSTFKNVEMTTNQTTGIKNTNTNIPASFQLSQNYPNPFNPATKIKFDLPQNSKVKLEVFDIAGRQVALLADGSYLAGSYEADFNAANLTTGVYFYRLTAGNLIETKKMMLVK